MLESGGFATGRQDTLLMRRTAPIVGAIAFFLYCCLLLVGAPFYAAPQPFPPTTPQVFHHDAHGLEKQYNRFLDAYNARDAQAMKREYAAFSLPDAKVWFSKYFPAADVEQLVWDYEAELPGHENGLVRLLSMKVWPPGTRFHAKCQLHKSDQQPTLKPDPEARVPISEVPVEQFEVEVLSQQGQSMSTLENYVYVDGAFRYLGKGAYPFWSMPDATRPVKPHSVEPTAPPPSVPSPGARALAR